MGIHVSRSILQWRITDTCFSDTSKWITKYLYEKMYLIGVQVICNFENTTQILCKLILLHFSHLVASAWAGFCLGQTKVIILRDLVFNHSSNFMFNLFVLLTLNVAYSVFASNMDQVGGDIFFSSGIMSNIFNKCSLLSKKLLTY